MRSSSNCWLFVCLVQLIPFFSLPASAQATPQAPSSNEILLQVILVPSAEHAQRVIERLHKGEDFAALAREVSIDPTANNGWDDGQVRPFQPAG
jgi:parvulin-like peptidyl-prolyl isomerase